MFFLRVNSSDLAGLIDCSIQYTKEKSASVIQLKAGTSKFSPSKKERRGTYLKQFRTLHINRLLKSLYQHITVIKRIQIEENKLVE